MKDLKVTIRVELQLDVFCVNREGLVKKKHRVFNVTTSNIQANQQPPVGMQFHIDKFGHSSTLDISEQQVFCGKELHWLQNVIQV